jgi:hypothetical protein
MRDGSVRIRFVVPVRDGRAGKQIAVKEARLAGRATTLAEVEHLDDAGQTRQCERQNVANPNRAVALRQALTVQAYMPVRCKVARTAARLHETGVNEPFVEAQP